MKDYEQGTKAELIHLLEARDEALEKSQAELAVREAALETASNAYDRAERAEELAEYLRSDLRIVKGKLATLKEEIGAAGLRILERGAREG